MEESRLDTSHTAEMIGAVANALGREVKVYVSPAAIQGGEPTGSSRPSDDDLPDDYYDLTPADYAVLLASKPKEEIHLKTKKIREKEKALAAKKVQRTKATIRVNFPDGFVVESIFKSTETISDIMALVRKSITRQDLAFYLYTTPPKRPFKDLQQNIVDANLCPGANVYFSFTQSPGVEIPREGPYLRAEVQELRDLHKLQEAPTDTGLSSLQDPVEQASPTPVAPAKRPTTDRKIPKWLKRPGCRGLYVFSRFVYPLLHHVRLGTVVVDKNPSMKAISSGVKVWSYCFHPSMVMNETWKIVDENLFIHP